jgi:hypothetical protein
MQDLDEEQSVNHWLMEVEFQNQMHDISRMLTMKN